MVRGDEAVVDAVGRAVRAVEVQKPEILPAREEEDSDLSRLLSDFLEDLPDTDRNIFILRYWHGHSVARLAKAYRMRPNTLSARLYRIREKFRTYLTERGYHV